jgi:hypothetical protein
VWKKVANSRVITEKENFMREKFEKAGRRWKKRRNAKKSFLDDGSGGSFEKKHAREHWKRINEENIGLEFDKLMKKVGYLKGSGI